MTKNGVCIYIHTYNYPYCYSSHRPSIKHPHSMVPKMLLHPNQRNHGLEVFDIGGMELPAGETLGVSTRKMLVLNGVQQVTMVTLGTQETCYTTSMEHFSLRNSRGRAFLV